MIKSKVRKSTKLNDVKSSYHGNLNHAVLAGNIMASTAKNKRRDEDSDNQQKPREPKDLKRKAKSSTPKQPKKKDEVNQVNLEDLKESLEKAFQIVKHRSSTKALDTKEIIKHLSAIEASVDPVSKSSVPKKNPSKAVPKSPKTSTRKVPVEDAPESSSAPKDTKKNPSKTVPKSPKTSTREVPVEDIPESTIRTGTSRAPKPTDPTKRKRDETRVKSEQESESTEPRNRAKKRTKKSRIPETSEESSSSSEDLIEDLEDEEQPPLDETPQARHRRIQREIRSGKTGSRDTRTRLSVRSNKLFNQGTTEEGRNFTRRNPDAPFKKKSRKPATGAKITNHAKGRMLKAIKIADQQYAGKLLRYYLNGFGYQLRLAEAQRKMQELTLPEIKKNRRYKAKGNKAARLVVDPRRRRAELNLRRLRRALNAIDQWLCPLLGDHPVEKDQSKIPFVCLCDSDEEQNMRAHPKRWKGREIKNPSRDEAKMLVSLLNFLMPPDKLGDMPGDAERYDGVGILNIIKEEEESDPEISTDNNDEGNAENDPETIPGKGSDSSEDSDEAVAGDIVEAVANKTAKAKPTELESDTNGTVEANTIEPESDSDIKVIEVKSKPPAATKT